jgi:hypothetical protein
LLSTGIANLGRVSFPRGSCLVRVSSEAVLMLTLDRYGFSCRATQDVPALKSRGTRLT